MIICQQYVLPFDATLLWIKVYPYLTGKERKVPQSKWIYMDRPNVRNLLIQMDSGPMDRLCYVNLDRQNGWRSNGPPMLRQFGPSKWTTV